jgi:CRISPR/Cas system CMR subunit Cmr6 (Cas7 group RAMP superfamily)
VLSNNQPDQVKRQKFTVDKFTAGNDNDKKVKAKENAQTLDLRNWSSEFNYVHPCACPAFLSRSIALKFEWTLKTPFFSRSMSEFDVIDNPISRDSLNGYPVLKASGIKGMLEQIAEYKDKEYEKILFGDQNDSDESGISGRMIIGDVVFSKTSFDVFSPHEREFGVADHPVTFEVVPAGAKAECGIFIYELNPGELDFKRTIFLIVESFKELLFEYGMSAKRSSGYGIAEKIDKICVKLGAVFSMPDQGMNKPFDEPEPKFSCPKYPAWHEAFVDSKNEIACVREKALERIVKYQSQKEKKTALKQVDNLKSDWAKKDKAVNLWDECKKINEQLKSINQETAKREDTAHKEWLDRKKKWESRKQDTFEFNSFESAMQAINQFEVAK